MTEHLDRLRALVGRDEARGLSAREDLNDFGRDLARIVADPETVDDLAERIGQLEPNSGAVATFVLEYLAQRAAES